MMISIWPVCSLLLTHFIADFLAQNDWMALNKSRWTDIFKWPWDTNLTQLNGLLALLTHAMVYSLCFFWIGSNSFVYWTFLLHLITDAITSKWTSKLWFIDFESGTGHPRWPLYARINNKRHWFFVVIGLDQLIHGVTLLWTLKLLGL